MQSLAPGENLVRSSAAMAPLTYGSLEIVVRRSLSGASVATQTTGTFFRAALWIHGLKSAGSPGATMIPFAPALHCFGQQFHVTFTQPGRCPELDFNGRLKWPCRFLNTLAQRIEKRSDLLRQIHGNLQLSPELQMARRHIRPIASFCAILRTRALVSGLMPGRSCNALSTVPIDTPSAVAMSLMPGSFVGSRRLSGSLVAMDST